MKRYRIAYLARNLWKIKVGWGTKKQRFADEEISVSWKCETPGTIGSTIIVKNINIELTTTSNQLPVTND